ncbi:rRNA accumulation- protein [Coemansia biformis]|uniref:rRNA accumulation- protein n=1 Tax=Coemansia biformis TaxID=1286918 RepID=A0A9W7YI25_9FUNG|nr:rRNA accumulation- protein [Coemansia biformis]
MESPQAKVHANKEAFIEGVDHILSKWTALELAVHNEWGGPDAREKREDVVDEIVEYFDKLASKRQTPEPTDLQELLLDIMAADFEVTLEDGSESEVAKLLCTIFAECKTGNFATVDRLADEREARERSGAVPSAVAQSRRHEQQGGGDEESDSSEDDDGDVSMEE